MKKYIAIFAVLFGFAAAAQAQDTTPPTLTVDAPVNGVDSTTDRITVTGVATDDEGVREVQYRVQGSRRWKKAILDDPGGTSVTYIYSLKIRKKGRSTRVYTRVIDTSKNESDQIGRKVRRARN